MAIKNIGSPIGPEHDRNHLPAPGDGDAFQESFAFAWYDPVSRIGGWQHFGMQRPRGIVDINSYLSHDGRIVGRYENLKLPMPDGDFTDLTVGPVSIRSQVPLTTHAISIDHGAARVDLVMEAFLGPYGMGHQDADSHWESFGRISGSALIDGATIPVSGLAFQDRSWGDRDMSSLVGFRLATAIFDETLVFRLFQMTRTDGQFDYGYVYDNGRFHEVAGLSLNVGMDTDCVNVRTAEIDVWTKDNRGYRLNARAMDRDLIIMRDGLSSSHGSTVYDCGGRLGIGFLDVLPLREPASFHRQQVGRMG